MKKKIEKFKVGDYVICKNAIDIEGLTIGKIYIAYEQHINYQKKYTKIKNNNYKKRADYVSLYSHRFRKATKKEINDNLIDITVRKLKNEI